MSDSLHTIDYTVIVLYFAAIVACGIYFGRYTKSTADFFLWWSTFRLVVGRRVMYCYSCRFLQFYQLF